MLEHFGIYTRSSGNKVVWAIASDISGIIERGEAKTPCFIDLPLANKVLEQSSDEVLIFHNSSYLETCIKYGLPRWQKNNWRTKKGNEVKYREMWKEFLSKSKNKRVYWTDISDKPKPIFYTQMVRLV